MILSDHDVQKLTLPSGVPETVDELESIVQDTFGISGHFCLHYKDVDFGNDLFTLLSTSEIKDKDTIKVVYVLEPPTVTLTYIDSSFSSNDCACQPFSEVSPSTSSNDTLTVSPEPTAGNLTYRFKGWPSEFPIPRFSYSSEILL